MAVPIPFTDNYQDLSTDKGFQFKFVCERCNNGYMSTFQYNVTGVAGDVLRAAGDLFGGIFGQAASSTYHIQRAVGGPAHDAALRTAVEELSPIFVQCGRCGNWVCRTVCFNDSRGQCVNCSPKMEHEIKAIESDATIQQLRSKAMSEVDMTGGVELESAVATSQCPSCHAAVPSGKKFCEECGASLAPRKTECSSCGAPMAAGKKFCGACGARA